MKEADDISRGTLECEWDKGARSFGFLFLCQRSLVIYIYMYKIICMDGINKLVIKGPAVLDSYLSTNEVLLFISIVTK